MILATDQTRTAIAIAMGRDKILDQHYKNARDYFQRLIASFAPLTEDRCFELVSKLPTNLTKEPYKGVIWHPTRKRMTGGKTLVRNLLLYMLDAYDGDEDKLHQDYAKALGAPQLLPVPYKLKQG